MKYKTSPVWVGAASASANDQVHVEIQSFLEALDSYPERFAREPEITFEQHRSSLAALAKAAGQD